MMKALAVLLHPLGDVNHPFVESIHDIQTLPAHQSLSSHLGYQMDCCGITRLVFKWPLFV